jgi:hypothetical protein
MITRAKERHRPIRVIIDGNNVDEAIKWMQDINNKGAAITRLCISGTGSNTIAKQVCEQLLPAYSQMTWSRRHES